jgi:hypothetical protein
MDMTEWLLACLAVTSFLVLIGTVFIYMMA